MVWVDDGGFGWIVERVRNQSHRRKRRDVGAFEFSYAKSDGSSHSERRGTMTTDPPGWCLRQRFPATLPDART